MKFWWDTFMAKVSTGREWVSRFMPGNSHTEEGRQLRLLVLTGMLTVAVLFFSGFSAFFLALRGAEQTMVPNVQGEELVDALIRLQEKELFPLVQVRYSSDPGLKGKVLDQRPSPGTQVKAGKRVNIVVSKGSVVDQVENFVGRNLDEVRVYLQTLFTAYKPLLKIQEPVTYVFDPLPSGTILEQKPAPGTELSDLTDLVLVVSRGPELEKIVLPSFVGIDFQQAVELLARSNIPFVFSVAEPQRGQTRGFVVAQEPPAGAEVEPGTRLGLTMAAPAPRSGSLVFGLFEYSLPSYPVAVDLKFEVVSPAGERRTLFTMKHPGGPLAIPYYQEVNSTLVLSIFNREVIRHGVPAP